MTKNRSYAKIPKSKKEDKYGPYGKPNAPVCENCLRWQQFGSGCYVYWAGKKSCSMKVRNMDEWSQMDQIIGPG